MYPEEVEEAVKLHPAIADCLVVGVPDDRFGEAVTAVVARRDGATVTGGELAAALDALALQATPPVRVRARDPRGPNGKADYKWAKEQAAIASE